MSTVTKLPFLQSSPLPRGTNILGGYLWQARLTNEVCKGNYSQEVNKCGKKGGEGQPIPIKLAAKYQCLKSKPNWSLCISPLSFTKRNRTLHILGGSCLPPHNGTAAAKIRRRKKKGEELERHQCLSSLLDGEKESDYTVPPHILQRWNLRIMVR